MKCFCTELTYFVIASQNLFKSVIDKILALNFLVIEHNSNIVMISKQHLLLGCIIKSLESIQKLLLTFYTFFDLQKSTNDLPYFFPCFINHFVIYVEFRFCFLQVSIQITQFIVGWDFQTFFFLLLVALFQVAIASVPYKEHKLYCCLLAVVQQLVSLYWIQYFRHNKNCFVKIQVDVFIGLKLQLCFFYFIIPTFSISFLILGPSSFSPSYLIIYLLSIIDFMVSDNMIMYTTLLLSFIFKITVILINNRMYLLYFV